MSTLLVCPIGIVIARALTAQTCIDMGYSPVWSSGNKPGTTEHAENELFLETDLASPTFWAEARETFKDDVKVLVTFDQDTADKFIADSGIKNFKVTLGPDTFVSLALFEANLEWEDPVEISSMGYYAGPGDYENYKSFTSITFKAGKYFHVKDPADQITTVGVRAKNGDIVLFSTHNKGVSVPTDPLGVAIRGMTIASFYNPKTIELGDCDLKVPMISAEATEVLKFLIGLTNGKFTVVDAQQGNQLKLDEKGVVIKSLTQETVVFESCAYVEEILVKPPFFITIIRPSLPEVPLLAGVIGEDACTDPQNRTPQQLRAAARGVVSTDILEEVHPTWDEDADTEEFEEPLVVTNDPADGLEALVVF